MSKPTQEALWLRHVCNETVAAAAEIKALNARLDGLSESLLMIIEKKKVQAVVPDQVASYPALKLWLELGHHRFRLDALANSLDLTARENAPPRPHPPKVDGGRDE